jgi:hypothetical protein
LFGEFKSAVAKDRVLLVTTGAEVILPDFEFFIL